MMKLYLFFFAMLLGLCTMTESMYAGPADPDPVQMKQPDGTTITILLKGDENLRWAETPDGYTLLYNDDGIYEYAVRNNYGELVPSGRKAHDSALRTPDEKGFLGSIERKLFYSPDQITLRNKVAEMHKSMRSKGVRAFPTTGSRKLVCILIGFSDLAFTETQANFNNLFNQVGYGTYGSVKDYYEENSYGQFQLTVDVAGPYTAANNHEYYGQNHATDPDIYDINVRELVTEAVNFADADVDFSDYDNDGDGNVDGVYIVYAGFNEAEGGGTNSIWYHAWSIPAVTLDGVDVSAYSCSAEYKGNTGTDISGIGNICHEFGHVMGAPDFYDTNYGDDGQYGGNGEWDVMSSGNFNGDRDCPAHYNPYTKEHTFGWSGHTVLNVQQEVTLLNSAEYNNHFYRFYTSTPGEFFLMENKQQVGFNTKLPGHGLIIYHVHKDVGTGAINVTHPQKFYPVCANAGTEPSATAADYGNINSMDTPFPGAGNKTEFTDLTLPSSKSWAGANTEKPIAFITEDPVTRTIHLCFMGCPPEADFEADDLGPCSDETVSFTDLSTYEPTSWSWSFTPSTVTYEGGTSASSQNPQVSFDAGGYYEVSLTATNAYGSDTETKSNYIYVYTAPVVTTQPGNVDAQWGDDISFTAAASGDPAPSVQWQLSTNGGGSFSDLPGETSMTLELSCITLDMDGYQYRAVFDNFCGTAYSDPAILTVSEKMVTAVITVIPNPQQYSDLVDIHVAIEGGYTCGEYAATGAEIFIGTQYMGMISFAPSGTDLTATLFDVALLEPVPYGTMPTGQMAPGDHLVTAVLDGVNPNYDIANPGEILAINCEDAEVTYNGGQFFSANPNNGDFSAPLSAFVVDDDDGSRGEIRNGDVTFREGDEFGPVLGAANVPLGLIDPANNVEGFATTDLTGTLTNAEQNGGGRIYEVWAGADNYYCGDLETPVTVVIAMPGGEYVTGGGHLVMTNTSGLYPGMNNAGKKMNFGLVMKWNKSGKNLQGKVNVIYRGTDGYNYKIKSNAINSMVTEEVMDGGMEFMKATISTKANLQKLTPEGVVDLGGNLTLVMTAWECTSDNTGAFDRIGVQLAGKGGSGIYFTSNWVDGNTVAQTLDGGKVQVGVSNQQFAVPVNTGTSVMDVYPNPAAGPVAFTFRLDERSHTTLDVYTASGQDIARIFAGDVDAGESRTIRFNEDLPEGIYYYILRTEQMVYSGKFIRVR